MQLAKALVEHSPSRLGEPIVDSGENHENDSANQYIVEMRDDEIGIRQLPTEWGHRQQDPGQSCDEKLEEEGYREEHGSAQADLAPPHGAEPVEDLDASWNTDQHRRGHEKSVAGRSQ